MEEGGQEADWSETSEGGVLSGSATDMSKGEGEGEGEDEDEEGWGRPRSRSSLLTWSLTSRGRLDPVHCILDKIDAHLAAIPAPYVLSSTLLKKTPPAIAKACVSASQSGTDSCQQDTNTKSKAGPTTLTQTEPEEEKATIFHTEDVPPDDDSVAAREASEDFLNKFDSVVVQQIDVRFKEIMCQKKGSPPPPRPVPRQWNHQHPPSSSPPPSSPPSPPPPLPSLAAAGNMTDNDSVVTEDFEHRFHSLLVLTDGNTSGDSGGRTSRARRHRHGGPQGRKGGSGSGPDWRTKRKNMNTIINSSATTTAGGGVKRSSSGFRVSFEEVQYSDDDKGEIETTKKEICEEVTSLTPSSRSESGSPDGRTERPKSLAITDADAVAATTDYASLDSASEEIERKSARIQRELQRERRARSVSPRRGHAASNVTVSFSPSAGAALPPRSVRHGVSTLYTPRQTPTQTAVQPHAEFSDPLAAEKLGFHIENADKMILGQELKTLRGALFTTKLHIRDAEKEAKHVKEKTEEARSDLLLVEYKRATAHKDLQRLMDDVDRKRAACQSLDTELEVKQREMRAVQSLGITAEEARTLHEENVALKQRQRGLEMRTVEREELTAQLASAKEQLLREQTHGRQQRQQLMEELERFKSRLEESQSGWGLAQRELVALETAFRRMERDKNDVIQEQSQEYKAFKQLARKESQENRQLLSQQVETLTSELQQLKVRVTDLQADNKAKDEHNLTLREQVTTLTQEIAEEQAARAAETEEHRQTLQRLRKETDGAMLKLRESLFLDKQRALEELRAELEQERKDNSSRSDERVAQMLAENSQLVAEKNAEISRLQETLREMQETHKAAERRLQDKLDLQVREAVSRERAAMERETQRRLQNERDNLARDTKQRVNEMQLTLDHERETSQRLTREIAQLKEELEEQRRLCREAAKEKLVAVARAKDQVREQSNAELETVRQKVKQEMQLEVDRLQAQLRSTEDEIRTLKAENQRLLSRDRDSLSSLDHTEKTIINEINEENRRSASVLGVSPRQVQFSNVTDSTTSRSQINAALANLRAVNEELRKHIEELTSELDSCRALITTMEKEKEESLENIRLEMEKKRTLELEKIKAKLIREHSQELAQVAQASARQSLATSMVGALRQKDQEIAQLRDSLSACRAESAQSRQTSRQHTEEMQQELEKSQALLRHCSTEQKRISQTQQGEITRLEKEIHKLAMMYSNKHLNNAFTSTPLHPRHQEQHQHHQHHHHHHQQQQQQQQRQQQFLQARIKQLDVENDALRRKHLSKNNLSVPDLLPLTSASLPTSSSTGRQLITKGGTIPTLTLTPTPTPSRLRTPTNLLLFHKASGDGEKEEEEEEEGGITRAEQSRSPGSLWHRPRAKRAGRADEDLLGVGQTGRDEQTAEHSERSEPGPDDTGEGLHPAAPPLQQLAGSGSGSRPQQC
ncbi:uncharacterized protein LOC143275070 [Babylonia areolata]|uniref:uncharacterized protein LOC143275070 n=1 Tax=Babylonia areolata TaxID=304850 RepID=UPI003FD091F3